MMLGVAYWAMISISPRFGMEGGLGLALAALFTWTGDTALILRDVHWVHKLAAVL